MNNVLVSKTSEILKLTASCVESLTHAVHCWVVVDVWEYFRFAMKAGFNKNVFKKKLGKFLVVSKKILDRLDFSRLELQSRQQKLQDCYKLFKWHECRYQTKQTVNKCNENNRIRERKIMLKAEKKLETTFLRFPANNAMKYYLQYSLHCHLFQLHFMARKSR